MDTRKRRQPGSRTRRALGIGSQKPRPGIRNLEPRTWNLVCAVVLVVAVLTVYANSLSAPFIFDDSLAIVSNPAIRSIGSAFSQPRNTPLAGRPIAGLSFALSFAAHELDPAGYRVTNVVIHAASALLLFAIIRRTLALPRIAERYRMSGVAVAFAATLLWAVHPLTTDAVTYLTQRTESLMALFFLLTLYASVRALSPNRRAAWEGLAVAACAAGMGTKESMVTAPVAVALFDRVFVFDSVRQGVQNRGRLYMSLALTWLLLAFLVASAPRSGSAGFATEIGVWTYLLNQTVMIARYLRLVFWPVDLVINYGTPVAYGLADVLPHAALVVALLVLTCVAFRWNRALAFLGAWFFITLAPSSSVVPIATEVGSERRMYLALMAVSVGLAIAIYQGMRKRSVPFVAVAAVVAIVFGAATIHRNNEHQSWLTLVQTTLERWPSDAAQAAVGSELVRLRRDEDALSHLRIGARTDVRARYNLGVALYNLKRYDEAIRELRILARDHPLREELPWALRLMGHAYGRLNRWPEAITQLQMTLAMTPRDEEAHRLLVISYNSYGVELAEAQAFREAVDAFRKAVALDPSTGSARYNLAAALFDNGQMEESFEEAQRAVAQDPANPDAHHLLGKLLALRGATPDAIAHLETAASLNPDDSIIREDLARVERRR